MPGQAHDPTGPHDVPKTPLPAVPIPPGAPKASPIPQGVEARAQRLIHAAGSVETAKTAIDSAADREEIPDFREDLLANRLGFLSRKELLGASQPFTAADQTAWWATQLEEGLWVIWNNDHMDAGKKFSSFDAAAKSLQPEAGDLSSSIWSVS